MDFGCYYDPTAKGRTPAGLIRGGFWLPDDAPPAAGRWATTAAWASRSSYTGHHYGAFNTEPRIASYIGIALGQIPAVHYFGGWRTFPDTCDWAWQEQKPIGEWRTYLGRRRLRGRLSYDDQLVVPTWGGSMFEALMVPLVVPEEEWGPNSWAVTHPLYVESQIEYGLGRGRLRLLGVSPGERPGRGYREYGVDVDRHGAPTVSTRPTSTS